MDYRRRMDQAEYEAITAAVLAKAEAGDLTACEQLLIEQLVQVRGDDPEQELRTLSNLTAIYGRAGRRVEASVAAGAREDARRKPKPRSMRWRAHRPLPVPSVFTSGAGLRTCSAVR